MVIASVAAIVITSIIAVVAYSANDMTNTSSMRSVDYRACGRNDAIVTSGFRDNSSNEAFAQLVAYSTLQDLVKDADVIVVGKVTSCIGIRGHPNAPNLELTDFNVTVERVIAGNVGAGDSLTVQLFTSGSEADFHIMNVGERYVLFLAYNDITKAHGPLGGPQGRYLVDNENLVYSLDYVYYPDLSFIRVKENGKPLENFISEIRSAEMIA